MRQELGRLGENIAAEYLQGQGYKILQRNFRCRSGEVDIICIRHKVLVFVEVKTRTGQIFGSPEESITPTKQTHLRKVALDFLGKYSQPFIEIRFDVIGIMMDEAKPSINHVIAAF